MSVDQATDYAIFTSSLRWYAHESILDDLHRLGPDVPHEGVPLLPLLGDSAVWQAVRAMLGPGAQLDECRHVHVSPPNGQPGEWHVDDYCGQPWPDGFRFAILCYFPQDTPPELGPTAIRVDGREILGGGPAGSCLLMAQHVEHRAAANVTGQPRYMIKYLFRVGQP